MVKMVCRRMLLSLSGEILPTPSCSRAPVQASQCSQAPVKVSWRSQAPVKVVLWRWKQRTSQETSRPVGPRPTPAAPSAWAQWWTSHSQTAACTNSVSLAWSSGLRYVAYFTRNGNILNFFVWFWFILYLLVLRKPNSVLPKLFNLYILEWSSEPPPPGHSKYASSRNMFPFDN